MTLLALAVASGAEVTAHHVDHGLRPGGSGEAAMVAEVAARWGAGFRAHRVDIADGPDLEERCRRARLELLPPGWLTGHTADDQAETVLMRLIRGTGPSGLAAMDEHRHPLLQLRRVETESLCEHLGIAPFEDPTNIDRRFTRNRIRHEVIPLLADVTGRDVVPLVNRTAELTRRQSAVIAGLAQAVDPTDAAALSAQPEPVATEALRMWWASSTGGAAPPDRRAIGRMMAVVSGEHRGCDVTAGWRLLRTRGRLRLVHDPGSGGASDGVAGGARPDTR